MFYTLETNQICRGLVEGVKIAICSTKHGDFAEGPKRHVWLQKGWEFGLCYGKLSSALNEMFRHVLLSGD